MPEGNRSGTIKGWLNILTWNEIIQLYKYLLVS